ncbi:hypothetical protein ACOMHN_010308 [Nucella lapillus]
MWSLRSHALYETKLADKEEQKKRQPTPVSLTWTLNLVTVSPVNRTQRNDNSKEPPRDDPNRDRLYKIRPLVKHLQEFQSVYTPDKYIAIDESLLLWKGQLVFKQYIPLKRARFGIRIIKVCEDSGYTYKFHIYTGKEDPAFQIQQNIPDDAGHLTPSEKTVVFMPVSPTRATTCSWTTQLVFWRQTVPIPADQGDSVHCGTLRENRAPAEVRQLVVNHADPVKAMSLGPCCLSNGSPEGWSTC